MAAYVKQADEVVLIFSKAEARALRDLMAEAAQMREDDDFMQKPLNPSVAAALDRATRCLETACEPGSRSGAAIQ